MSLTSSMHAEVHAIVGDMVAIQVRDVPESIRDDLAREARARGLSLQALLREMLEREARRARNREFLRTYNPPERNSRAEPFDVPAYLDEQHEARAERILGSDRREPPAPGSPS
ncbi:hypothetical protein [Microbacterium sp.]|uniref:hypothetical protein n=1 Tax=Microbacterium sp. TaxID=51671 RepID=UPI0039E4CA81